MTSDPDGLETQPRAWNAIPLLFGLVVLGFVYSPTLSFDYLMNDEAQFGMLSCSTPLENLVRSEYLYRGRPVAGALFWATGQAHLMDPSVRLTIRCVHLLLMALTAIWFFRLLRPYMPSSTIRALVVVVIGSNPAMQGINAYSIQMIAQVHVPFWCGLAAFALHFRCRFASLSGRVLQRIGVVIAVVLGLHCTQNFALASLPLVAAAAMRDAPEDRRRIVTHIGLVLLALAISTASYKLAPQILDRPDVDRYSEGAQALSALDSPLDLLCLVVDPRTYASVFDLWFPPPPFNDLAVGEETKLRIGGTLMAAWMLLIVAWAFLQRLPSSLRSENITRLIRVGLAVFSLFVLASVFLVVTSPHGPRWSREHLRIVPVALVVCSLGSIANAIATRTAARVRTATRGVAIVGVLVMALGAQSAILRNYVDLRTDVLDFIRIELSSRPADAFDEVLIVPPRRNGGGRRDESEPPHWPRVSSFRGEPIGGWAGTLPVQTLEPAFYLYAMRELGIPIKPVRVSFEAPAAGDRALVIDWGTFVRARGMKVWRR